jgi:amino acid permease
MKRWMMTLIVAFLLSTTNDSVAQCSICTKTAQQLGDKPAKALNKGIIYLMVAPLAIMGFVGFRWWKNNGRG